MVAKGQMIALRLNRMPKWNQTRFEWNFEDTHSGYEGIPIIIKDTTITVEKMYICSTQKRDVQISITFRKPGNKVFAEPVLLNPLYTLLGQALPDAVNLHSEWPNHSTLYCNIPLLKRTHFCEYALLLASQILTTLEVKDMDFFLRKLSIIQVTFVYTPVVGRIQGEWIALERYILNELKYHTTAD